MIDPSMTDLMDTSTEVIAKLQNEMANMQSNNEALASRLEMQRGTIQTYERTHEQVKNYLMEQMDTDNIEDETAQEIANILGFELEKEVSFEVSVTFYGSAKIGPGEDAETLIANLNYGMDGGYYSELEFDVEDVQVDNVSISEY